jgi:hypothetical protein
MQYLELNPMVSENLTHLKRTVAAAVEMMRSIEACIVQNWFQFVP